MRSLLATIGCLVAMLAVVACSRSPEPEPAAPVQPVSSIVESQPAVAAGGAGAVVRGYYEANDGGLFTACGETSRRRVTTIAPATRAALRELGSASDQARFVVAQGRLVDREEVELGAFELVSGDAWNCESRFADFIHGARGLDGAWSLEVTPSAVAFVATPGGKPASFAYRPFLIEDGALRFEAEEAGRKITISLQTQACVDRMTDTVFAQQATIVADGRTYQGCAWRGRNDP